jgi:uncharacterized protein (TIGR03437 family)
LKLIRNTGVILGMILRNFFLCLLFSGLFVSHAGAQCSAAPSTYSATCNELQGHLTSFQGILTSQWNKTKAPAAFSAELTSADCNQGLAVLLSPRTINSVQTQLDGFARVGVQSVTFAVGFPILYQPFFTFNNDPQDYQTILNFYKAVAAAVHQHGMRVLIETSVMFPQIATNLPLAAYYQTLHPAPPSAAVTAGRGAVALTIATELQPDWLNLGSEPDTQAALLGLNTPYTPQQYGDEIGTIVTQLRTAGIIGKPLIGAGVGTWSQEASGYIQALTATNLDYIDFHIYSINSYGTVNFLMAAPGYIDMAHAAGKGAAISEAWMKKVSDEQLAGKSDLGVENQFSNNTTGSIDTFSFWAPLDAQFVQELADLANWKNLYYISPFPTEFFYAYLDYSQFGTQMPSTILSAEIQATAAALNQSPIPLTATGNAYAAAIQTAGPTMVSAASGSAPVAPESIVSMYGANGASGTMAATSQPLPTNLDNVSVTITDSAGTQALLPLFFVSPGQINAQIPPGLPTGLAQLAISAPSGTITSSVNLATVATGLFTANETGQGVAAAQVATNNPDGTQTITDVFNSPCAAGSCVPVPIDLSQGPSVLVLYGTGIRNRAAVSDVTVQIGSQTLPANYAGPTSGYTGLDQVNIPLPSNLAGSGTVNVRVLVAGTASNTVTVAFK